MESKFTVKAQKIGGVNSNDNQVSIFSSPLVVEPEDSISARRGLLYAVVEIKSANKFDPNLILKVITDELQNEYFSNSEGTPLQCLEKTLNSIRYKVTNLFSDPKVITPSDLEFHAAVSVLWGSVLYVIQFGGSCSYLIREGRIKPINTLSEGDFSIASGMVKDGDIVILGSKSFCETNPPEVLLKGTSSFLNRPEVSAVILKFHIEKGGSSERLEIKSSDITTIRVRRKFRFQPKRKLLGLVIIAIGILLAMSIGYAFSKSRGQKASTASEVLTSSSANIDEAVSLIGVDDAKARDLLMNAKKALEDSKGKVNASELERLLKTANEKLDEVNRIKEFEEEVFYDMRVEDKEINPTEISASGDDSLFVVDSVSNKYYRIILSASPQVRVVESTQSASPRLLYPTDTGVDFLGKDGFYRFDNEGDQISKVNVALEKPSAEVTAFSSYIGNVYFVYNGVILKNSISWSDESKPVENPVSMAIDGSIYLLKSGGEILKFVSGAPSTLQLKNVEPPLSSPSQIYTSFDFKNIYILDKGNARIVSVDKEGVLQAQYSLSDFSKFAGDLRNMTVTSDEKTIFVLVGSRIYKIPL